MRTPNRGQWWPARWFTGLRLVAVLACLIVVMPAAAARPAPPAAGETQMPGARSLGEYLNADGTLTLPAGQAMSLDARGYRLVSGPGEAPRFAAANPDTVPGNENWARDLSPSIPGTDGWVSVLATDAAGRVYVGGNFNMAGEVNANYIAQWNGSAWTGLGLMEGDPNSLAVDAADNLYAGGDFTTIGGTYFNKIAKWDGTTWSALGSGMNESVFALKVNPAGNLYAGGEFTTAGNHVSAHVARWTAADGVRGVTSGTYTLYANNLPVTIRVVTPGTLDQLAVQRFNRSHPQANPDLDTGCYWEIVGSDASGNPASGYVVD